MILLALHRSNLRLFLCSYVNKIHVKHFQRFQPAPEKNRAIIIHYESRKVVSVTFRYFYEELQINKLFNFYRNTDEKCSVALRRMSEKINFFLNSKRENKFSYLDEDKVTVELVSKSNKYVNDLDVIPCLDSFVDANNCLRIGNIEYSLVINPPVITTLQLKNKNILAGYMIYPSNLEVFNCNIEDIQFVWYRTIHKFDSLEEAKNLKKWQWEKFGEGFKIFTSENDESKLLKVVGTSSKEDNLSGSRVEAISNVLISSKSEISPFERRHKFTSNILNENFLRVVSYNLLADFYADSDYSRSVLFPTCPEWALEISYRKQLFMKEILGYNADIICLQELDSKVFLNDLKPIFSYYDLEGTFNSKFGLSAEGIAIFYRKEKLRLKEETCYILSQEIEKNSIFKELLEKLNQNNTLKETFAKQKVIFQVSIFERKCSPSKMLLVGTTHLFAAADSDHIRLLQAWMCLHLLKETAKRLKQENPGSEVSIIMCGDFNTTPCDPTYQLMTSQHVDAEDKAWSSKPGEEVKDINLSHDLPLENACGTPDYTHYTVGFAGCLDYIFYEKDKFSVEQVVPFPSHEEVTAHKALPSITFPSDHIALVADFKWKVIN